MRSVELGGQDLGEPKPTQKDSADTPPIPLISSYPVYKKFRRNSIGFWSRGSVFVLALLFRDRMMILVRSFPDDLEHQAAAARTVVKIYIDDLLPGAQGQPVIDEGDC